MYVQVNYQKKIIEDSLTILKTYDQQKLLKLTEMQNLKNLCDTIKIF